MNVRAEFQGFNTNIQRSDFALKSFDDIEYRALNRLNKSKVNGQFQGELFCKINRAAFCSFCISQDLIRLSTNKEDKKLIPIKDLKVFLQKHHARTSGKKQDLIERVDSIDSSFFGKHYYILTDKGSEFLHEYWDLRAELNTRSAEELLLLKLNRCNITFPAYYKLRKKLSSCYPDNDVIWSLLNDQVLEYSFQKNYASLRETYLNMALILEEDKMYDHAFEYFGMTICFDLNGYSVSEKPQLIPWLATRLICHYEYCSDAMLRVIYSQCRINKLFFSEENFISLINEVVSSKRYLSYIECDNLVLKYISG